LGAADALRASIGSIIDPVDQIEHEGRRRSLLAELGEERFAAMWEEGRALTVEQAVDYALKNQSD
jgi:hypothetical protein